MCYAEQKEGAELFCRKGEDDFHSTAKQLGAFFLRAIFDTLSMAPGTKTKPPG